MKPLPLLIAIFAAGCTQIPELDDAETPALRKARYPALIPLHEALGPQVIPQEEAAELEEELNDRRDALSGRAQTLREAETE